MAKPLAVPFEQIPRRGHLPKRINLDLQCYVELDNGSWLGYRTHRMEDVESVITLEADGQPVGSYQTCVRCGFTWPPGAY